MPEASSDEVLALLGALYVRNAKLQQLVGQQQQALEAQAGRIKELEKDHAQPPPPNGLKIPIAKP